ncbi:MAG: hypothetical protein WKG00_28930 [Polyangiaceae bacterium]
MLPRRLAGLVEQLVDAGVDARPSLLVAAGLALRALLGDGDIGEHTEIIYDTVKALSRTTTADSRLTGKARLAAWAADGFALLAEERRARADRDAAGLTLELARAPLGADRMVLARGAHRCSGLVAELCAAAVHPASAGCDVPAALLELAWADASIDDATLLALAARVARPRQRAEDLPEDELDLDPRARPLETLERVVLAATPRANLAPRSALTVVALDSRRVRYVLTAMAQWKGSLTGGRLARVLRQHAGALSAAQAEARTRQARVEVWTERRMNEMELSVALAVGHLTSAEVVRRIQIGRQEVGDGTALAAGVECAPRSRAGGGLPVLAWATRERASRPAALALWLLLERFERERAPRSSRRPSTRRRGAGAVGRGRQGRARRHRG